MCLHVRWRGVVWIREGIGRRVHTVPPYPIISGATTLKPKLNNMGI